MRASCNLLVAGMVLALATSSLAGTTPTPTATPTSTPVATATATPTAIPGCDLTIEINALRGGSPTVTVGDTKNITAKARIVRGTAARGTTVHTTLKIEALDGTGLIETRTSCPHRLEVGKGGQGGTFGMDILQCVGSSIRFRATFLGNENDDCSKPACPLATRVITKTCK
jgi:hypothetical protein